MKIIAIEGVDGSGKTAQTTLLANRLQAGGASVLTRDYPRYKSLVGGMIGAMLADGRASGLDAYSMSLWYAADRAADYETMKAEGIAQRDFVVFNRYSLSSAVYQSSRHSDPKAIFEWVLKLEHEALKLPRPDLYIVLDAEVDETARRNDSKRGRDYIDAGADVYEGDRTLQQKALDAYRAYAASVDTCVIVKATDGTRYRTESEIHGEIYDIVAQRFGLLK